MSRFGSFGIDFSPARNDEGPWRRLVAGRYNLDHREVRLTGGDYADALPDAVRHMEGPMAHTGCVLLMLLCREIAKHNKVVLTGEGADEFFAGYKRYGQWRELRGKARLASLVPAATLAAARSLARLPPFCRTRPGNFFDRARRLPGHARYLPRIDLEAGCARTGRRQIRRFSQPAFFCRPDLLPRITAAPARQARHGEFAGSARALRALAASRALSIEFPTICAPRAGETKPLLKKIAAHELPHDLVYRRKIGLTIPANDWLADETALGRYLPLLTDS